MLPPTPTDSPTQKVAGLGLPKEIKRAVTPELVPDRMGDRLPVTPEMRAVTPDLVLDRMMDRIDV